MPIPGTTETILTNSLGIIADDPAGASAKLGVSSLGTIGTLYSFRGADTQKVQDTLGFGPLVEAVVHHLKQSGGRTVYAVPLTASVAGTNTAVTQVGGGPVVTLTGAPVDDFQGIMKVVAAGALGTSTFQFSLDGGDTYSALLTTAATYLMPNSGVTLNMAAGSYVAGTTYSWTSTAPGFSNTDFSTGMDSLLANQTTPFRFVHLVGQGVDAAATLTLATTMHSKLNAALGQKRFTRGLVESPAVDKAGLISSFASFVGDRVGVVGGFLELISDVNGRVYKRSLGHPLAPRLARNPRSVDAIRTAADSNIESLAGVVRLVPSGAAASTGYHDEGVTPGFDAARFICAMTIPGIPGFYICNPNLMSIPGSDFKWLQYGFVMDRACEVVNQAMTKYISKRLRLDPVTGFILGAEAASIESDIGGQVRAAIVQNGDAVAATVVVNRADNLLSDPTLRLKVRITPFPHAKTVTAELGFFNPTIAS